MKVPLLPASQKAKTGTEGVGRPALPLQDTPTVARLPYSSPCLLQRAEEDRSWPHRHLCMTPPHCSHSVSAVGYMREQVPRTEVAERVWGVCGEDEVNFLGVCEVFLAWKLLFNPNPGSPGESIYSQGHIVWRVGGLWDEIVAKKTKLS